MKNFLFKNYPILIIIALSGLIIWPLFLPGYFSHQDDMQVMRIFEMRKCFSDLQLPCRWVPDLGFGNGFPLFNYYSVFPYYLGAILSYIFGYVGAAKLLFLVPLSLGGISFYLLAGKLYGKIAGLSGAILFMFAPYRALDSYVRGAVAESFAIALIPLVFYFTLLLLKRRTVLNFLGTALSLTFFLTSHNIMVILFLPVLLIWIVYWGVKEKLGNLSSVFCALTIGFGLAAFFWAPALLESPLIQTANLTRFDLDFRANFVTIKQLFFERDWGYGLADLGLPEKLSFQVGWPHWWLMALLIVLLPVIRFPNLLLISLFMVLFLGSLLMAHVKSSIIWEQIGFLRFIQFPWRFLAPAIFSASFLGSFLVTIFSEKRQIWMALIIISVTVLLNFGYFHPGKYYPDQGDREKLSGVLWNEQRKAAIMDYLPKTAIEAREPAPSQPLIVNGKALISDYRNYSNHFSFYIKVNEPSLIEIPVYDFPNWMVIVNKVKVSHDRNSYMGRINLSFLAGEYYVEGLFKDTPIRTLANLTSVLSLLGLVLLLVYGKSKKIFS